MDLQPNLHVLFAYDGTAACARGGAALAQLAASWELSTTLVHVAPPGRSAGGGRILEAFVPPVEHTQRCQRLLLESADPAGAIGEFCEHGPFDLVLAPASDRGVAGLWSGSLRATLMRRCAVPVLTMGRNVRPQREARAIRRVACLVDFDDHPGRLVALAGQMATAARAQLVALTVVPSIHDGTHAEILGSRAPLTAADARERLAALVEHLPGAEVQAGDGRPEAALRAMLADSDADLLLVGRGGIGAGLWPRRFPRHLDRLPIPVMTFDPGAIAVDDWPFRRAASRRLHLVRARPVDVLDPAVPAGA
ncbi:MAG: universal stress protein [Vicinamibacterales bacterium]